MAAKQIKVEASDRINNVAIKKEPNEIEWNPVIFKTDEMSREEYLGMDSPTT